MLIGVSKSLEATKLQGQSLSRVQAIALTALTLSTLVFLLAQNFSQINSLLLSQLS